MDRHQAPRQHPRLGYALQLTTVRFLGTFLEDPAAVPGTVLHTLSSRLGIVDAACVLAYRESEQRWRHTTEIRARYGYREFADGGVQFRLGRWLCALCWTGTDRPQIPDRDLLEVAFDAWSLVGQLLSEAVIALGGDPLDLTMPCRHVPVRIKRYSQHEFFLSVDGIDLDQEERKWQEEKARRTTAAGDSE